MITPEFAEHIVSQGAVLSTNGGHSTAVSFGNPMLEKQAALEYCAVSPVAEFLRIKLTGKDRVKFLHNFCTNDVKGMEEGDVLEAFLTDARARILGHGYIASFHGHLELWMLPGDAESMSKHLQKYVIVEDVSVDIMASSAVLAVAGPKAAEVVADALQFSVQASGTCLQAGGCYLISVKWNSQPIVFIATGDNGPSIRVWKALTASGAKPAGHLAFESLRIAERFPCVGVDLTDANMAPEADRNTIAICYTKGCYLGQEPIARLDAMGHVNRQLYCGAIESVTGDGIDTNEKLPIVTSMVEVAASDKSGLAVLPVKSVSAGNSIICRTQAGQPVRFTVSQTE